MLNIYLEHYKLPDLRYVEDIEYEWINSKHDLSSDFVKLIINTFEGKYTDSNTFVSKITGASVHISNISTGSKAAIMLYENPDVIYNFGQVGLNVRDFLICRLHEGHMHLRSFDGFYPTIECDVDSPPDVAVNGEHFTDWGFLNDRIKDGVYA